MLLDDTGDGSARKEGGRHVKIVVSFQDEMKWKEVSCILSQALTYKWLCLWILCYVIIWFGGFYWKILLKCEKLKINIYFFNKIVYWSISSDRQSTWALTSVVMLKAKNTSSSCLVSHLQWLSILQFLIGTIGTGCEPVLVIQAC